MCNLFDPPLSLEMSFLLYAAVIIFCVCATFVICAIFAGGHADDNQEKREQKIIDKLKKKGRNILEDKLGVPLSIGKSFVFSEDMPGSHSLNSLSKIEKITDDFIVFSQNHTGSPFKMSLKEFQANRPIRIFF